MRLIVCKEQSLDQGRVWFDCEIFDSLGLVKSSILYLYQANHPTFSLPKDRTQQETYTAVDRPV